MSFLIKIFIFCFIFTNLSANTNLEKIVYINMEKLFNESLVGTSLNNQITKLNKTNKDNIIKLEKEIKSDDENINSQKNILSENELNKKISSLNVKIKEYQKILKNNQEDIKKKKLKGTNIILNNLKPILSEYLKENSISIVLQKQNVIIGKKELDITEDIIKILDEKIKKIDIN